MIRAEISGNLARLPARAAALAERQRRTDDHRWRSARWLWPSFANGDR